VQSQECGACVNGSLTAVGTGCSPCGAYAREQAVTPPVEPGTLQMTPPVVSRAHTRGGTSRVHTRAEATAARTRAKKETDRRSSDAYGGTWIFSEEKFLKDKSRLRPPTNVSERCHSE